MNKKQLEELSKSLGDYPHTQLDWLTGEQPAEPTYFGIRCNQELVPANICRILLDAPDFNGLLTTGPKRPIITFTYKVT